MTKAPSGNKNAQPNSLFTLDSNDSEPVEIPSVTKLLNRKKLGLAPASGTITLSKPKMAAKRLPGQPEIQKVHGRSRHLKLAHWTKESLAAATDPFQKAVHYLVEKGARQVLLLTPPETIKSSAADIQLNALCAYMTEDKDELWRGLSLSPSMIPEIWKRLFTQGIFEIVPTVSLNSSDPSVAFVKKAFGLKPSEFFVLVRCGAPHACTGILALVSSTSMMGDIASAFNAPKSGDRAA